MSEAAPSLMAIVIDILARSPDASARELARHIRLTGRGVTKREVNSVLYTALAAGVILRAEGRPPRWRLATPVSAAEPPGPRLKGEQVGGPGKWVVKADED